MLISSRQETAGEAEPQKTETEREGARESETCGPIYDRQKTKKQQQQQQQHEKREIFKQLPGCWQAGWLAAWLSWATWLTWATSFNYGAAASWSHTQ